MWQTKYASAIPKNLGVGVNFGRAVKVISSPGVRSPWHRACWLWKSNFDGFWPNLLKSSKNQIKKVFWGIFWQKLTSFFSAAMYLTEAGTYSQLPRQPKKICLVSNLYSNLVWSFWVVLRRKIKIWIRGKKVQFITESCVFKAETPTNFPF